MKTKMPNISADEGETFKRLKKPTFTEMKAMMNAESYGDSAFKDTNPALEIHARRMKLLEDNYWTFTEYKRIDLMV